MHKDSTTQAKQKKDEREEVLKEIRQLENRQKILENKQRNRGQGVPDCPVPSSGGGGTVRKTAEIREQAVSPLFTRAHYPRYSTIRGNFQIVAIYKDFKEISSDNVTTILESPATDSPFSVLQNFPFAGRTISRSNPGYACSQSPVKAQRTVRS